MTAVAGEHGAGPVNPSGDGGADDVEAEARRIELERILAELPEGMTVDAYGDVVPDTENGWQGCPLCIGRGVVRMEFEQSPLHMTCPDCRGHGEVGTGSLVPGKDHLMCSTCAGAGYIEKVVWERIERERSETAAQQTNP